VKELEPHHWTVATNVCNALMTRSTMPVEAILRDEIARDLAENQETAFLYGHGIGQPLGIMHANGLDASSDYSIANGTLTPSNLLKMACQLSSCTNAVWLMGRQAYCDILESTNSTGDYYWWNLIVQSGPGQGVTRPSLVGYPVYISEMATGDFNTAGDYPAVLGDFSTSYFIADGPAVGLRRVEDAYANTTCWIARGNTDGMSVNDCHFVRAKIT
jgi:HK97 family phage major capsid protein